ncbi:MAG: ribosome recycling factor [Deltaproteobacteria bacterium]|nr:ribosome recycling factor [Deltaproteobacteria bacterium]
MIDDTIKELEESISKSHDALRRDLARIRTGRASVTLLDGIKVNYYGTPTPLNQMATLAVPEPRLIVINPWDKNVLSDIEKAISGADLGLNPMNDGNIIRLPIPSLTEERRKELVKVVRRTGEDSKIAIRNHRRDAKEMLKSLQKDGEISEDDLHRAIDEVQKRTDEGTKKVDEMVQAKEKEVLEF